MILLKLTIQNRQELGGGDGQEMTANEYRVYFWGYEKILKLDNGDGCAILNIETTELYTSKDKFYGMCFI